MSQHLFAVDRLVSGGSERLIDNGYPLGPHALVDSARRARPEHGPRVRRADDRGRRRHLPRGARCARGAERVAAGRRRAPGRLRLPAGGELRPGRVQGGARGAVRGRFRDRPEPARQGRRGVAAGASAAGAATRRARDRERLRLQLSRARLACRNGDRLGRGRARPGGPRRGHGRGDSPRATRRARGARRRRGAGGRDRPRDRPHCPLRRLRDLRPGRRRARQPLQPALAAGGVRDLALGRLPARAGRRRRAGDRLLPRRRVRGRRRSPTGCGDPPTAPAARSPRPSQPRRSSGSTRLSPGRPTRRRRRW